MNTTTNNVTLFWGDMSSPWSFGNAINIPRDYVFIPTLGLVDEASKRITAYASKFADVFLKMEKVEGKSNPVGICVFPSSEEEIKKEILCEKFPKGNCSKIFVELINNRGEFIASVREERYKNGELADVSEFEAEGDEADHYLGQTDWSGESFDEGDCYSSGYLA